MSDYHSLKNKEEKSKKATSRMDFHFHSTCSDGALSPVEVVSRAVSKGIEMMSLTDHDTTAGLIEAKSQANILGVRFINGIELSCEWGGHTIHVVGLNFDENSPVMRSVEEAQLDSRYQRAEEIARRLLRKVRCDTLVAATQAAGGHVPGRPHFAQVLLAQGVVQNTQEAFQKYLGAGKIGDVRSFWPSLPEITQWICQSGGVAVIAHPRKYKMTASKLRKLLDTFCASGGEGIEVLTSGQKQGDTGFLFDICRRYSLYASMGSDFHSPQFPWADFGTLPLLPEGLKPVWSLFN